MYKIQIDNVVYYFNSIEHMNQLFSENTDAWMTLRYCSMAVDIEKNEIVKNRFAAEQIADDFMKAQMKFENTKPA